MRERSENLDQGPNWRVLFVRRVALGLSCSVCLRTSLRVPPSEVAEIVPRLT